MKAERLRKRAEFLAARRGRRLNGPFFMIEALDRGDPKPARYGLTITKKVGNAVERNRIRRRLREAIRTVCRADMVAGFDYVIVARRDLLEAPFELVSSELSRRFLRAGQVKPAGQAKPAGQGRPERTGTAETRPGGHPSGTT